MAGRPFCELESSAQDVYWQLESLILRDYKQFAAKLRLVEMEALATKAAEYSLNQKGKVLCYVAMFEALGKAYEDLGAILLALRKRFEDEVPIVFTLINYRPGEAGIAKAIGSNADEIAARLEPMFKAIRPYGSRGSSDYLRWRREFLHAIELIADNQKRHSSPFQKVKHAALVVSDGAAFKTNLPRGPAAFYRNRTGIDPIIIHSFKYSEEEFDTMRQSLGVAAHVIEDLLTIYLERFYPTE